jgi:transcriptional regulator with XRE-family HTH domain
VTLSKTFGANVRHYRKARRMNQRQFADAAELSVAMMGKIERGEAAPSFPSVEKIAAALDIPEAVLFSAGTLTVPAGERGRLLQRINIQLSKLNNNDLARAAKMLTALTD